MRRDPDPIHLGTVNKKKMYFVSCSSADLAASPSDIYDIFDSDLASTCFIGKAGKFPEIILYKGSIHGAATNASLSIVQTDWDRQLGEAANVDIRGVWGRSMDVVSFPGQGSCTIPLSFLSLSLFSGRKRGLIGSRPRLAFETKCETHRSRR